MDKHSLLCELKRVSSEIGRTPKRDEFIALANIKRHHIDKLFGGFSILVEAAGLDVKPRKISDDIFKKDIRQELKVDQDYKQKLDLGSHFEDTVIIGDTHFPFISVDALTALYQFIDETKPKVVIQIGDLYDCLSHASFPKSMNIYTPKDEMDFGREMAMKMWETIQKLSPGVRCYQILGNHCIRPIKRMIELYPAGEQFFTIKPFFEFEGVHTNHDVRSPLILQGVNYIHGFLSKLGAHRDLLGANVVCGHSHLGGVSFKNVYGRVLFELNAGYLGDPFSKAFSYMPIRIPQWTLGLGHIDRFGPRFIPF